MKGVINEIRGHHFALGEHKPEFGTTTAATYKYDPSLAAGARMTLDAELKNDLRNTHYKLGYMNDNNQTTHQSSYVPLQPLNNKIDSHKLKATSIQLNPGNRKVFDGKTIYMVDYIKEQAADG